MVFAFRKGCFRLHLYQKQRIRKVTEKPEKTFVGCLSVSRPALLSDNRWRRIEEL